MADLTSYNYVYVVTKAALSVLAGGEVEVASYCTINGEVRPPLTSTNEVQVVSQCLISREASPIYLIHAQSHLYDKRGPYVDPETDLFMPGGEPLALRLVNGMGGRKVPWGVLIGIAEVEDADVRTWTATSGPNVGKTVGVALENPRTTLVIQAIFLTGNPPPRRGDAFFWEKANGQTVRAICLKKSFLWSQGGWLAVQIDATHWDGGMGRISP